MPDRADLAPIQQPPGDADYGEIGAGYARVRRADPRIEVAIYAALGPARSVLNVGAGAGSYEPSDRHVVPIEPAPEMRAQRPAELPPAIDATAAALPLDDDSVDAAMAVLSIHHWPDLEAGLREMRRVSRDRVVIFSFDPAQLERLWLMEYAPELLRVEESRYPPIETIAAVLGGEVEVIPVPVPIDCSDGFSEAFYARPEAFLDPAVRRAQSAWSFVDDGDEARAVAALASDLESGAWDERHGAWRQRPEFEGAIRLVVAQ